MKQLLYKSEALGPPEVQREVEASLREQVVGVAEILHEELLKAGDPALAAGRMEAAQQRLLRRREHEASGLSKLLKGLRATSQPPTATTHRAQQLTAEAPVAVGTAGMTRMSAPKGYESDSGVNGDAAGSRSSTSLSSSPSGASSSSSDAAASASPPQSGTATGGTGAQHAQSATAATASGREGGGWEVSQAALGDALQRRVGFRLELGPSSVPHPEAGTGVFLRGDVRAGTVVAIFPGILYGRTQLMSMPNFPKIDTANPYLSCRYDQSIVDSKPWGRGDLGPAAQGDVEAAARAPASAPQPLPGDGAAVCGEGEAAPHGGRQWWSWAGPLSPTLRNLEGRHPLALGHFVNHPGKGQEPNVLEAALDVPLGHPAVDAAGRPWVRAYLPSLQPPLQYNPASMGEEEEEDEEEDEEEERDGARRAKAVHADKRSPGELRAEALLLPPGDAVRLLVLVAVRSLHDGEELLQNYRMNPHVVRPDWYVVHDAEAEQRRWAKSKSIDLGFRRPPNKTDLKP